MRATSGCAADQSPDCQVRVTTSIVRCRKTDGSVERAAPSTMHRMMAENCRG